MPKANDHRTKVTKMLIRKAFTDLLRHKPIQSISIKELCDAAKINRGTFYRHYSDIYDLLDQLEVEMTQDLKEALQPLLQADAGPTPLEITTGIFQILKDNADICTVTLGPFGDKEFAARLIQTGRENYGEAYARLFKDATPKQLDYYYAFVSSGCIGLLEKWLEEGMVSSAEEIAATAEDIMVHGIGFLQKQGGST
ncbi:TetR/AcrR family transcriptional regulator [Ruminococcaceae bacterium OttesenSCG-928-I18]|nr:TetR/AcrR family transcriptional regulator [Ruminococcaceae bacterium OttesenSCG-928-I18]